MKINRHTLWQAFKDLTRVIRYGELDPPEHVYLPEKDLCYIAVAKNACSAIKQTLDPKIRRENLNQHLYLINKTKRRNPKAAFTFSVHRNPFERLVSCYENKYESWKIEQGYFMYQKHYFGYITPKDDFETFAQKVCTIPDFLSERHFKSQYSSLYTWKKRPKCNLVIPITKLNEDFPEIAENYSLEPLLPINSSKKKKHWTEYYSPELLEKVFKRYKKDFDYFGYTEEYKQLQSVQTTTS